MYLRILLKYPLYIGNDPPKLSGLLDVAREGDVYPKWIDIYLKLIPENKHYQVLRSDNPNQCEKCTQLMFEKWLEIDPFPTWNKFVKALEEAGLESVAFRINQEMLIQGIYTYIRYLTSYIKTADCISGIF